MGGLRRFAVVAVAAGIVAALVWAARGRSGATPPFTPAPTPAIRPRNVVLITIDALRADHLSLYGYARLTSPHIDAFARGATTYDHAYATATFTSPSVASLLTGLYPSAHGVRYLRQPLDADTWTLPAHLHARGWETAAVVSNWVLSAAVSGLASSFDHYDDHMTEPELVRKDLLQRNAEDTTAAAREWLGARNGERPFFLWVHYMDPHGPYTPPAPFDRRFHGGQQHEVKRAKIPWYQQIGRVTDLSRYVDAYDGEIAYADEYVGVLLEELRTEGRLADTVVIVTADHGEVLTDRHRGRVRYFNHGHHVWEELSRVPLVVYYPGTPAGRSDALVSLVDIVPTVLALLGEPAPHSFDGAPLGAPVSRQPISEASNKHLRAIRAGHWKVIAEVDTGPVKQVRAARVFDLAADPHERHGLEPARLPGSEALVAILADQLARDTEDLVALKTRLDLARLADRGQADKDRQALRALGYVQ